MTLESTVDVSALIAGEPVTLVLMDGAPVDVALILLVVIVVELAVAVALVLVTGAPGDVALVLLVVLVVELLVAAVGAVVVAVAPAVTVVISVGPV